MKLFKAFKLLISFSFVFICGWCKAQTVVRYNQLGYTPEDIKVVVAASKDQQFRLHHYQLKNQKTGKVVLQVNQPSEKDYGAYGPFRHSYRISLTAIEQPGTYRLVLNDSIVSGIITIDHRVYRGKADLCLRFLRGQRCGFNPLVNDSCHPSKDYSMGGPVPDSTRMDVSGGWHQAGNYIQEVNTAASATWYLLSAYRHFPEIFNDAVETNGLAGKNNNPDIMDETKWGLDWLIKMHPAIDNIYQQVGDGSTAFSRDSRPIYFASRNKKSTITETCTMAGQLSSAFSLGSMLLNHTDLNYAARLSERAVNAYDWGLASSNNSGSSAPGCLDALTLAADQLFQLKKDRQYLDDLDKLRENRLDHDSRNHRSAGEVLQLVSFLSTDLEAVSDCQRQRNNIGKIYEMAKGNAFLRGLPFNQGSNKLTVAFAGQCMNYRVTCNDASFAELEQANIDWLFGCNPWGVTMVSGFPVSKSVNDPFGIRYPTGLKFGLVTGPVVPAIYKATDGVSLFKKDEFAAWQSSLAVYHDDRADFTTNEPTVDGTAALIYLLASREHEALKNAPNSMEVVDGAIVRGDSSKKRIALVFLGDEYGSGAKAIRQILSKEKMKASFFVTSRFVKSNPTYIRQLRVGGHYIGPNGPARVSNCDVPGCDSLMAASVAMSVMADYQALKPYGITPKSSPVFLPNTQSYNCALSRWAIDQNLKLLNPTPGTLSLNDNSLPGESSYAGSDQIFQDVMAKAHEKPFGLNGYFLVFHTDADATRTDRFYMLLPLLLQELKNEGYEFVRADEMAGLKPLAVKAPARKPAAKKKRRR